MAIMCCSKTPPSDSPVPALDHLLYAVPDLEQGITTLERRLGVRAALGGQHLGQGTRNAIIGLGEGRYLEVIAPDPQQPAPATPRWFGIDEVMQPRLVAWVMKWKDVAAGWESAHAQGLTLGPVRTGSRKRPDGTTISWAFTDPHTLPGDGLVPFLIDWGQGPHPSDQAPGRLQLVGLRAEHPQPELIRSMLQKLHVSIPIKHGPQAALIATLDTPSGRIELR